MSSRPADLFHSFATFRKLVFAENYSLSASVSESSPANLLHSFATSGKPVSVNKYTLSASASELVIGGLVP